MFLKLSVCFQRRLFSLSRHCQRQTAMMAETCSCPFTILITIIIIININIIIIIIINIKIYHSPTSPTLFGVPCRDHVLD